MENKINIKVKVFAEMSSNKVVREKDRILVYVKARKKNLEANEAVINLISKEMNVEISKIKIIKGKRSQNKTLEIIC